MPGDGEPSSGRLGNFQTLLVELVAQRGRIPLANGDVITAESLNMADKAVIQFFDAGSTDAQLTNDTFSPEKIGQQFLRDVTTDTVNGLRDLGDKINKATFGVFDTTVTTVKAAITVAGAVFNSAQQSIAGGDQVPREQIRELQEDVTKLATGALKKNLGRLREVAVEKSTGQPLDELQKKLLDWAGELADSLLEKVDLQDARATLSQVISQFQANQDVQNKLAQTPEPPDNSSNISTREPDLTFEAKEGDTNPPSQTLDIQNAGALARCSTAKSPPHQIECTTRRVQLGGWGPEAPTRTQCP